MIGAAIGDIVGSRYEYHTMKQKNFPFFEKGRCFFTDDTVCTAAVIESLLDGIDPAFSLRQWGRRYSNVDYGLHFARWLKDVSAGPYYSFGNGAAMRISPVGFLSKSEEEVVRVSDRVTKVSHDHPEGIAGARAVSLSIFLARLGIDKSDIRHRIGLEFGYDLSLSLDDIRSDYGYDVSCQGTVPPALICAFEAEDFEDAIRNAVSLGGDADTLAAITGGLAEALYAIPEAISREGKEFLDPSLLSVFDRLYAESREDDLETKKKRP